METAPARIQLEYRWGRLLLFGGVFGKAGWNCYSKNALVRPTNFAMYYTWFLISKPAPTPPASLHSRDRLGWLGGRAFWEL